MLNGRTGSHDHRADRFSIAHGASSATRGRPRQRRPDISRAQELLAWAPRTRLRDGLIRTISYFEKLLSENEVRAALIASEAG
jgi:nucleoside-diphosphate-sugar epimerase